MLMKPPTASEPATETVTATAAIKTEITSPATAGQRGVRVSPMTEVAPAESHSAHPSTGIHPKASARIESASEAVPHGLAARRLAGRASQGGRERPEVCCRLSFPRSFKICIEAPGGVQHGGGRIKILIMPQGRYGGAARIVVALKDVTLKELRDLLAVEVEVMP